LPNIYSRLVSAKATGILPTERFSMDNSPWKTRDSKILYSNPHIAFRKDSVINPAGKRGEYGVVELSAGVFIVAIATNHSIYLIRQFRYPVQTITWELPAGSTEASETTLEAAQRELAEEAGLKANQWELLGSFFTAPGYSNDVNYVFLAQDLHNTNHDGNDPDERIDSKKLFSLRDIADMLQADTPFDGPTITAVTMACARLGLKIG